MSAVVVRYRVKPGRAEENAGLVRAVYAQLAERQPPGFRYATFALEDEVSFVHIAFGDDAASAALTELPAFKEFQRELAERCDEPPQLTRLTTPVGSYGF
jgi:quinol monooxygenase YgiN